MPGLPAKFFTSTVAGPHTLSRLLAAPTLSPAAPHGRICLVAWGPQSTPTPPWPGGPKGHLDAVTRRLADLILGHGQAITTHFVPGSYLRLSISNAASMELPSSQSTSINSMVLLVTGSNCFGPTWLNAAWPASAPPLCVRIR